MAEDFLETLKEHMISAIENPGEASASESFTISKPDDMSNKDWNAWIDKIRLEWNDPAARAAAADGFSSSSSA